MAGKKQKPSDASGKARYLPDHVLGVSVEGLSLGWESAKSLFSPGKVEGTFKGLLRSADERLAFGLFMAGCLLAFVISVLSNLAFFYVLALETDIVGEVVSEEIPRPDISMVAQASAINLVAYAVFAFAIHIAVERAAFLIARASKGTGSRDQHMLLSSVVWVAASMSMAIGLLGPFYCLSLIATASVVLVTLLYLMLFCQAKAYSIVHDFSMEHAVMIAIPALLAKLALWIMASQVLSSIIGISAEVV
ncbi:MAG: hypothetical protein V1827_03615 [Candidatus Micrarchaeota archaeon]